MISTIVANAGTIAYYTLKFGARAALYVGKYALAMYILS